MDLVCLSVFYLCVISDCLHDVEIRSLWELYHLLACCHAAAFIWDYSNASLIVLLDRKDSIQNIRGVIKYCVVSYGIDS